jgi:hypothetical protein
MYIFTRYEPQDIQTECAVSSVRPSKPVGLEGTSRTFTYSSGQGRNPELLYVFDEGMQKFDKTECITAS